MKEGRVEIKGRNYETHIPIRDLRIEKDVLSARTDGRTALAGMPGVVLLAVTILLGIPIVEISTILFWSMLGVSVFLVVVGFVFVKKIKYHIYHYRTGLVAFDVGNTNSSGFEQFCSCLENKIQSYQNEHDKPLYSAEAAESLHE